VEEAIEEIIRTWADKLRQTLGESEGEEAAVRLSTRYAEAFSAAYREAFSPRESLEDIAVIEALEEAQPTAVDLYRKRGEHGGRASLKVYAHGQPIPLSRRVPMLENLGFTVDNERTYKVEPRGGRERRAYLHDMSLERARGGSIDIRAIDSRVEETLMAVLRGEAESDRFNALVTEAGLSWREAVLLRAYGRYLLQAGAPYQLDYIADVLAKHPAITARLVALFTARFDPARPGDAAARQAAGQAISDEIADLLDTVSNLDEDRIIRRTLNLILSTVRTNYFQRSADGGERPALALKFLPRQIEGLPLPRPAFEIFVHSARVDGVHMRFGPVARGGIRWSDRPADFRTEVLGLVKAQHVKNSVIVPVGAKGGFVPKRLPPASERDAWLKEGTEAYKVFIGALLDVTDTLDGIVLDPPKDVVRLDGDDPYLVVAADKGTATFSDTANRISLDAEFLAGRCLRLGRLAGL
jgi:glutamate dehydrogenase